MKFIIIIIFITININVNSQDTIYINPYLTSIIKFNIPIRKTIIGTRNKQVVESIINDNTLVLQSKYPHFYQKFLNTNILVFFNNDSIKNYILRYNDLLFSNFEYNFTNNKFINEYDSFYLIKNSQKYNYFNKLKNNLVGFNTTKYDITLTLNAIYTDGNDAFMKFIIENNSNTNYNISNLSPINIVGKATKLYSTQEDIIPTTWEIYFPVVYANDTKFFIIRFNKLRLNDGQTLLFSLSEISSVGNRLLTINLKPEIINKIQFFK